MSTSERLYILANMSSSQKLDRRINSAPGRTTQPSEPYPVNESPKSNWFLATIWVSTAIFVGLQLTVRAPVLSDLFIKILVAAALIICTFAALIKHSSDRSEFFAFNHSVKTKPLYDALIILSATAVGLWLRLSAMTANFQEDEFQHLSAAVGYLRYGRFVRWDFYRHIVRGPYKRAWPFTWLVAQSFKLFGISTVSGRLVSLIFGLALIVLAYYLGKALTKDFRVGAAAALLVAVSRTFITMSIYMRMYAMFVVVFALFAYLLMKAIESKDSISPIKGVSIPYLAAAGIFLYLSVLVHVITLVAIIGIIVYLIACVPVDYKRDGKVTFSKYLAGLGVLFCLGLVGLGWIVIGGQGFFGFNLISIVANFDYFSLAVLPVPSVLGLPLLALGLICSLGNRKSAFFASIFTGGLFFFAFFGARYVSTYYISNIILFSYFFMIIGLIKLRRLIDVKPYYSVILAAVVTLTLFNSYTLYRDYRLKMDKAAPNYDLIFAYLEKRITKGSKIWMVFPRHYYLARHPGLRIADIENAADNKKFNRRSISRMIADQRPVYVLWPTKKSYHVAPETKEFIVKNMKPLFIGNDKYGFRVYAVEPRSRF